VDIGFFGESILINGVLDFLSFYLHFFIHLLYACIHAIPPASIPGSAYLFQSLAHFMSLQGFACAHNFNLRFQPDFRTAWTRHRLGGHTV
jgi:hypothetical protein